MLRKLFQHWLTGTTRSVVIHRTLRFEQCESRCLLSAVPGFSSDPGSLNKIFLDFDGHLVSDSYWINATPDSVGNDNKDIHAPVYNMPGDEDYDSQGNMLPFSQQELAYIEMAWQFIAEDFAPFDVNVTTVEPHPDSFAAGGPNGEKAMRVLFTSRFDDPRLGEC